MTNSLTIQELQEESRMTRLIKDERGMTLVELLATVVILAIIAGIGIVAIGNVIQNSREDSAVSEVQQAMNAAKLYQSSPPEAITDGFNLQEVIDAKFLEVTTSSWVKPENIKFKIDSNGTLTMFVPIGELKAGKKTNNVAVGTESAGAAAGVVNELDRKKLDFK